MTNLKFKILLLVIILSSLVSPLNSNKDNYLDLFDGVVKLNASTGDTNPNIVCSSTPYTNLTSYPTANNIIVNTYMGGTLLLDNTFFSTNITPTNSNIVYNAICFQTVPSFGVLKDLPNSAIPIVSVDGNFKTVNTIQYVATQSVSGIACFKMYVEGMNTNDNTYFNTNVFNVEVGSGNTSDVCQITIQDRCLTNPLLCEGSSSSSSSSVETGTTSGTLTIQTVTEVKPEAKAVSAKVVMQEEEPKNKEEKIEAVTFDPSKLTGGKLKPSLGVLSQSDDRLSIQDPYSCGLNVHGLIEYGGNFDNLETIVTLKNKNGIKYSLPVKLDKISGIYSAIVDYSTIPKDSYTVFYSIKSKLSNSILSQGQYEAFITNECTQYKEMPQLKLARTGGINNSTSISPLVLILLSVISITTFNKKNN